VKNLLLKTVAVEDEDFLKDLFFDVRRGEFEVAGLHSEQLKMLLGMQYAAQKQSYGAAFPNAKHTIIELDGEKIGQLLTAQNENEIHLIDISILSSFRGRGIGSFFLKKLKDESEKVTLSVFKTNEGAIRLYEKHGFKFVSEEGMYYQMEWKNA